MIGPCSGDDQTIILPLTAQSAIPTSSPQHIADPSQVSKVLSQLDSEGTGVNLFRLVLNPESFGQTVENMFYLSFLVRDGRAGIEVGEDGEILVREWMKDVVVAIILFRWWE